MMEFVTVLILILVLALGFGIGVIFAKKIPIWEKKDERSGFLIIAEVPGEEPYLFLELTESVQEVKRKKRVIFDVSHK